MGLADHPRSRCARGLGHRERWLGCWLLADAKPLDLVPVPSGGTHATDANLATSAATSASCDRWRTLWHNAHGGAATPEYVFDNRAPETEQRFGALEVLYDPISIRHLEPYVRAGSHCLEVGGGSGSIALWMSQRVGDHGRVLVTDINTRFLETIAAPNVEVRQHDIVSDPLEEAAFDVAHTRLVLLHLPERERALERMVAALKPGGWLVLQEYDALSMKPDPTMFDEHLPKTLVVMWDLMLSRGANVRFGRELFPLLVKMGLSDVEAEGHVTMHRGGSAGARLFRANFDQMHDAIVGPGGVTEEEFQQDCDHLDDPDMIWPSQVMWTVRARKP